MQELPYAQIRLEDSFWSPRLELNAHRSIFHQYEMLEASGCIDNFRILLGEKEGFREGWFFADSDAYKWLDAAARISPPDPGLNALMDGVIDLIGRAQAADGYIFTYNQIHFPETRWTNLQIEHELYCHGHLIEAGVAHHLASGKNSLLAIARKAADMLVGEFMSGGPERTPGHEEIEIGLLRLYQLTQHSPYLDLAQHFIEQRGRNRFYAISIYTQNVSVEARKKIVQQQRQTYAAKHPEYAISKVPPPNFAKQPPFATQRSNLNSLSGKYFQQHAPIRRQTVPEGHAVRFGYLQTAAAMLNRLRPDKTLEVAMEKAWEHMVTRRMYVTGGIGSLPSNEGFGRDYELDPEFAYNETCASLASQFWSWELALTTGKAQYSDLFEWQLYNASAVGMGLNGESYLYNNPLAIHGGITRKAWYAVPCCPSNLSRTLASLGKYIYATGKNEVWVHQYFGSRASLNAGGPLKVQIESALPWAGKVRLHIDPAEALDFSLYLRLPSWMAAPEEKTGRAEPEVKIHSQGTATVIDTSGAGLIQAGSPTAQGYDPRRSRFLALRRNWVAGDVVELDFPMPICRQHTLAKVKNHRGKTALTCGPLVYCLESLDNPGIDIFNVRLRPDSLHTEWMADLLGGVNVLRGESVNGKALLFIPYPLWGNRGESQMVVWVNEQPGSGGNR